MPEHVKEAEDAGACVQLGNSCVHFQLWLWPGAVLINREQVCVWMLFLSVQAGKKLNDCNLG